MAENNDNNNDEQEIQTEEVALGEAQRHDPNAPQDEVFISQAMLNARQEAIGETRKYAGPVSDEKIETLSEEMDAEESFASDVPPTECEEEPEEYEEEE